MNVAHTYASCSEGMLEGAWERRVHCHLREDRYTILYNPRVTPTFNTLTRLPLTLYTSLTLFAIMIKVRTSLYHSDSRSQYVCCRYGA